jgi:acetyl-CoA carboxylase carboxyltransferase component
MGPKQAVDLVHRREIAAAEDPSRAREALADRYAGEHLTAVASAAAGVIDEVVPPSETRTRLARALGTFGTPAATARPARNIPL